MAKPLKPSVCIETVCERLPIADALACVRAAGMDAFEFWTWWDKDLDELRRSRDQHGLQIAGCCTKFISLVDPDKRAEYIAGLKESIETANALGCNLLISQVGNEMSGVTRADQHRSLVEGLKTAAGLLEDAGITLVIEPLNVLVDHAGYYLVRSDEAFQIIDEVGSPQVKVVFDIYHQQISEGHLIANITNNIDKIGHFHAAGNPGRHEPQIGEINYPQILEAIVQVGFTGYLGLEYYPRDDPVTGLKEIAGWLA